MTTWDRLKVRQQNERYTLCKEAVEKNHGNISHAAKSLGVNRKQIHREFKRGFIPTQENTK